VSESAGAAPAPPSSRGGRENVFTHKLGPLPMWGWLAIVGGLLVAWRLYSNKTNASAAASQQGQTATGTSSGDTSANLVPQFVNQTYVATSAPLASTTADSSGGSSTGGTASTPTNPAPVGSSTQPKPTTTMGGWHYPAPTALALVNQSSKGVSMSWDAVTGPSGQHPNSYTVATYDSKGKLVDQFSTAAGKTSANEFGKGGKGLAKGTYHTNVWANGGPVAPPHSTVQYTLSA